MEQTDVIEPCREFQIWREAQGLYGARYGTYLVRELGDLLTEPRIGEELYVELRFNAELRSDYEATADRLGDIIAEASLSAKRDGAVFESKTDEVGETVARMMRAADGLPGKLEPTETPEQRQARHWGWPAKDALPRAETWLHERVNWKAEVDNLRAAVEWRDDELARLSRLLAALIPTSAADPEQEEVCASHGLPAAVMETLPGDRFDGCGDPACTLCATVLSAAEELQKLSEETTSPEHFVRTIDRTWAQETLRSGEAEQTEAAALFNAEAAPIDEAMTCEPQETNDTGETTVIPVEEAPCWSVTYMSVPVETEKPAWAGCDWPEFCD